MFQNLNLKFQLEYTFTCIPKLKNKLFLKFFKHMFRKVNEKFQFITFIF